MAISFRAPKPKPIPQAPMGPPTPNTAAAVGAVLPKPSTAPAAPGPTPPSPSSLSPQYFSPPGNAVQGPPVPPGYVQGRAAVTPQAGPSLTTGTPQGTLPFNAPHPVPQPSPAPAPSRPLGSTFGGVGSNIQNILSGVTPSRAGVATGASQALAAQATPPPSPTGMAPMGGGMQLPPSPPPSGPAPMGGGMQVPPVSPVQRPYGDAADSSFFNDQGRLGAPGSTRGPVLPSPFDPSALTMRGQWNQPGAFDQLAPGPQPNGTTTIPFPGSPTRLPTNQGFPTSPVVPPSYANPFPFPTGPLPSGPNAVKAQTAAASSGAPGPALPIKPPTAPAQYADAIKAGGLMDNTRAAEFQKTSGYQPGVTVGGAYGQPSPIRDPRSADTQKQITDAQNVARFGNGREAELARLNNQGFKAPPDKQHDFGLTNSDKFAEGGKRKEAYSQGELDKIQAARDKLNSPERQKYLTDRASKVASRKEAASGRVQENAIARSDSRKFRLGIMDNNTRFAFQNPQAAAARDVGLANADAIKGKTQADRELRQNQIDATKENAQTHAKAIVDAARARVTGDALANDRPDPFAEKPPATPERDMTPGDLKLMPKQAAYDYLRQKHGPEQANRMMNEMHGTGNFNYEQNPGGPTLWKSIYDSFFDGFRPAGGPEQPAATSTARMGGGMQLPNANGKPLPKKGTAAADAKRRGAFEH